MTDSSPPDGWEPTTIGEVAVRVTDGTHQTPDFTNDGVPFLVIRNVVGGEVDWSSVSKHVSQAVYIEHTKRFRPSRGDVLYTAVGSFGVPVEVKTNRDFMFQRHIAHIRPKSAAIAPSFMVQTLSAPAQQKYAKDVARGVAQKTVTLGLLRAMPIELPPLNEQRRIVKKIDALFAHSKKAKASLDRVPKLLDKLKKSILAAAFRGDLTADWRAKNPVGSETGGEPAQVLLDRIRIERRARWEEAELAKMRAKGKAPKNDKWKAKYKEPAPVDTTGLPELPEGWCWASLGDVVFNIESGKSPKAHGHPAKSHEVGVLKQSALSWGEFRPEENKALHTKSMPKPEAAVRDGDLLVSRANTVELVGAVVIVVGDHSNLMLSDKTLRLETTGGKAMKRYLVHALRTHWVRKVYEGDATGTSDSMRNLSQNKLLSAPVALAPKSERDAIVKVLERAFASSKVIANEIAMCGVRRQRLNQTILAKAFRGELVPQDPNDEPASVLLDRIRAEREAAEASKPKRGRKKKAAR